MKFEKEDIITTDDGQDYVVVDTANYDDNTYVYLINHSNKNDILIQRLVINGQDYELNPIDSKDEFETVAQMFYNRNKKTIEDLEEQ